MDYIQADRQDKKLKLGEIDKKIIYAYSQNCRLNKKKLASQLHISPQKLQYRVDKLQDTLFTPDVIVDPTAIGLNMYLLSVEHVGKPAFTSFKEHDEVYLVTEVTGSKDFLAIVVTNEIKDFLRRTLPETYVKTYPIKNIQPDDFNGFGVDMERVKTSEKQPLDLNRKHYDILASTMKHPQKSAYQLSKDIDYDHRTVQKYQEYLHEHGIIRKWRYQIDVFKMGFEAYFIHVDLGVDDVDRLKKYQYEDKYSGFLYEGISEVFFWYLPRDASELHTFISDIYENFTIHSLDVYQVGRFYYLENTPKILEKHCEKKAKE